MKNTADAQFISLRGQDMLALRAALRSVNTLWRPMPAIARHDRT